MRLFWPVADDTVDDAEVRVRPQDDLLVYPAEVPYLRSACIECFHTVDGLGLPLTVGAVGVGNDSGGDHYLPLLHYG